MREQAKLVHLREKHCGHKFALESDAHCAWGILVFMRRWNFSAGGMACFNITKEM
jgi:hypothetical protein